MPDDPRRAREGFKTLLPPFVLFFLILAVVIVAGYAFTTI